jgi:glycosyltransferase involved in cell wall biosynthesis
MVSLPRISVILPTFNRWPMVQEAVQSVLDQTYVSYECLVVDDGSSDGTFERLQAQFGARLRLFRKENGGVSAARNLGIRESQGELIAFLDSDDLWLPKKLEKQAAFFDEHPEARICQTTERWVRKGRRVNLPETHRKRGGDLFKESLLRCMVTPSSVMVRRNLLDEVGLFDEALPVCEDYDLWLRVTCRYPVGLIEEDLLVRRGGRPDQLSAGHSQDKYRIRSLEKLMASKDLDEARRKAALSVMRERCRIYVSGCVKRGRDEEGRLYSALIEQTEGAA